MSKKQILAFESFLNDDRKGAVIVDSDSLLESALDFNQTKISVWQGKKKKCGATIMGFFYNDRWYFIVESWQYCKWYQTNKKCSIFNFSIAANQYMVGCFTPFHACIDNVIH